MRVLRGGLVMAAVMLVLAAGAKAATPTVDTWGYLPTRDGTLLRYDLLRPATLVGQRLPVLINYEGYAAGTDATDNGVSTYSDRLMSRGYALLGVSVRGTGCSQGQFDPFDHTMGEDGYDAVEWAARQPWSDGRVGMIGVSFGGITQLVTAGDHRPTCGRSPPPPRPRTCTAMSPTPAASSSMTSASRGPASRKRVERPLWPRSRRRRATPNAWSTMPSTRLPMTPSISSQS